MSISTIYRCLLLATLPLYISIELFQTYLKQIAMSKAFFLSTVLILTCQRLLLAQADTLRQPFGEVSAMVTPNNAKITYSMSASILFGGKKKGWQNSLHLDVQTRDLAATNDGAKNFYSFQFGKNYAFQRKRFIAKSCSSIGLFMYQRILPNLGARSYGIIVSQSLEVGVSLKKVNISTGFYMALGYGYFKRYFEVPDYYHDPFKFTLIANPFVKITFKK